MTMDSEKDYQCFAEKLFQLAKKAECTQPGRVELRVSDPIKQLLEMRMMEKDKIRNAEYSLQRLIKRRLKEALKDYKHRRRIAENERKQCCFYKISHWWH